MHGHYIQRPRESDDKQTTVKGSHEQELYKILSLLSKAFRANVKVNEERKAEKRQKNHNL